MTESTPRTSSGHSGEHERFERELAEWLEHVGRGSRKRVRLEKLVTARGLLKPVSLAQRFAMKSREVGFIPTVKLLGERVKQMRQSA